MLAKEVENPAQKGTGAIDIRVRRNAYGRQIESTILTSECALPGGEMEMVYIRAPRIEETGPGVEVLAKRDGHPVLVRQGKVLAATFHPELTGDTRVHEIFLKMVRNGASGEQCMSLYELSAKLNDGKREEALGLQRQGPADRQHRQRVRIHPAIPRPAGNLRTLQRPRLRGAWVSLQPVRSPGARHR